MTKPYETEALLERIGVRAPVRRDAGAHAGSPTTVREIVDPACRSEESTLVGCSAALDQVRRQIAQVAATDSTVLITGETGTGKELVARALHASSARRDRALVTLNCAALPRELIESELFGHEKGAFTGALAQRRGRFELADGGTLLLDEVGDFPLEAQAKLLRVLQERQFERVGGTRTLCVDVRLVAATHRDLQADVASGRFRADLYYRLNVFPIMLPPLRARREDIGPLLEVVARRLARRLGRELSGIAPTFLAAAVAYDWPGNVRELENLVERALIVSQGGLLDAVLPASAPAPAAAGEVAHGDALEEVERAHLTRVLQSRHWVIEGGAGAAHVLGLNPSTLRGRLRKLGIHKPR